MKNLNRERGFDLEPWEEFDMIGGTSTGGYVILWSLLFIFPWLGSVFRSYMGKQDYSAPSTT